MRKKKNTDIMSDMTQMIAVPNSDCAKEVNASSDAGGRTKGNFIQQAGAELNQTQPQLG